MIKKSIPVSQPQLPCFSNEEALAIIAASNANALIKHDDATFGEIAKSGDYLGRLQLMTSSSEACKEGKIGINRYALVEGQNMLDLTGAVDVLLITWRPKAIDMSNDERIITCYDNKDAEFTRIQEKSEIKDSKCMYGPEFLVWVPSVEKFATFFMGSKSARRESVSVSARMKDPSQSATLKSQMIKTKSYTWAAPLCTPCTTPFAMPPIDLLKKEADKFNNPPKEAVERVEASASTSGGRAV